VCRLGSQGRFDVSKRLLWHLEVLTVDLGKAQKDSLQTAVLGRCREQLFQGGGCLMP
jgi:hypothetical protein